MTLDMSIVTDTFSLFFVLKTGRVILFDSIVEFIILLDNIPW